MNTLGRNENSHVGLMVQGFCGKDISFNRISRFKANILYDIQLRFTNYVTLNPKMYALVWFLANSDVAIVVVAVANAQKGLGCAHTSTPIAIRKATGSVG